jgi:hypothetical protein
MKPDGLRDVPPDSHSGGSTPIATATVMARLVEMADDPDGRIYPDDVPVLRRAIQILSRGGAMKVRALVQRAEPGLRLPETVVPVTRDFGNGCIGIAELWQAENGDIYAEMELREETHGTPAVGIRNGEILEVSICRSPNVDPSIPSI